MDKRTDRLTAAYVDLAVNVRTTFGLSAGIRTLQDEGVSPAVIQRVLIDGGPKRADSASNNEHLPTGSLN